jgi:hypothetical protein
MLSMPPRLGRRIVLVSLACAVGGLIILGGLVWRAVTIGDAAPERVAEVFAAARTALRTRTPLVDIDEQGHVTRRESEPTRTPQPIGRVKAMAYQPRVERIVRADVPFWFLKLKGPAARLALRDTGVDLERLGITPADLERHGPGIVVDQLSSSGARLLVWTE